MKKWKLQEWVIVGCLAITIPSLLTCGYMAISKDVIIAERDLITVEYNESQEKIKSLEQEIQGYKQHKIDVNHDMALLESQVEVMKAEVIEIKNELAEYKESTASYFINRYDLTDDELEVLYKIVEAEATNQDFDSKVNVAHVILNRVYSEKFPDAIREVVFQKRQFSPISDLRYWKVEVTDHTKQAIYYALRSEDTTQGSLYFMQESASDSENVSWFKGRLTYVMSDSSGHTFWK